jgi:DNA-binding PadR family transcriptional regulator
MSIRETLLKQLLYPLLLNQLNNQPMHGYALIQEFKKNHGVELPTSTVYPLLDEMERKKVINGERSQHLNRLRITYSLTDKGRMVLKGYNLELTAIFKQLMKQREESENFVKLPFEQRLYS